jgi:hypothetical protein
MEDRNAKLKQQLNLSQNWMETDVESLDNTIRQKFELPYDWNPRKQTHLQNFLSTKYDEAKTSGFDAQMNKRDDDLSRITWAIFSSASIDKLAISWIKCKPSPITPKTFWHAEWNTTLFISAIKLALGINLFEAMPKCGTCGEDTKGGLHFINSKSCSGVNARDRETNYVMGFWTKILTGQPVSYEERGDPNLQSRPADFKFHKVEGPHLIALCVDQTQVSIAAHADEITRHARNKRTGINTISPVERSERRKFHKYNQLDFGDKPFTKKQVAAHFAAPPQLAVVNGEKRCFWAVGMTLFGSLGPCCIEFLKYLAAGAVERKFFRRKEEAFEALASELVRFQVQQIMEHFLDQMSYDPRPPRRIPPPRSELF